jgi:hypothetical protein
MKTLEELEMGKSVFSIRLALSDGWDFVKKYMAYYILGGVITFVSVLIAGIIPFVGSITNNLILSPCFMAGAVYVTWRISLGKGWVDLGDMFKGFNYLQPLAISSLIQGATTLILSVLIFYNFFPELTHLFKISQGADALTKQEEIKSAFLQLINSKFIVSLIIWMVAMLFLTAVWVFKTHFIVIYKMQAWPAMEMSRKVVMHNLLSLIAFFFIMGIIIMASVLPCGIGLLVSLPLMIGATYSAFAQITHCDKSGEIDKEMFDFMGEEKNRV